MTESQPADPTTDSAVSATMPSVPLAFLVFLASLIFGVLRQGGYHRDEFIPLCILMAVVAVVFVVLSRAWSAIAVGTAMVIPLAVSTAVSTVLADGPTDAPATFALLAILALAVAVGSSIVPELERTVVSAALLVGIVVAGTAWWGVVARYEPWGRVTEDLWRGSSSITYSNAAAAVVGPLALIALARLVRRRRVDLALVAFVLLVGLGATQSRGGIAAFAVGFLGLLVVLRGEGLAVMARNLLPTVVPAVIVTGVLVGTATASGDGNLAANIAALLVAIALVVVSTVVPTRVAAVIGVGAVVVALGGLALGPADLGGALSKRLSVSSTTTALGPDERVLFGDRAKEWSTAWDQVIERPMVGHGPGVVDLRWEADGRRLRAIFVHNEYLELAVTHGVLGIVAFLIAAGIARGFIVRRRGSSDEAAFVLLAIGVFLLHSSVDFLWHVPALPILFAMLLGVVARSAVPPTRA